MLTAVLKVLAFGFAAAGVLHLVLGLNADALLGAEIPVAVIADPALDSQNRFYGTAFTLYGVILYLGSTDLVRYRPVLRALLLVFFAAGLARLVSIAVRGVPPPLVLWLLASELLLPPVLLYWLREPRSAG